MIMTKVVRKKSVIKNLSKNWVVNREMYKKSKRYQKNILTKVVQKNIVHQNPKK